MHAARMGYQCLELLTEGGLTLPIQGEPAEWLRSVRQGEVPFDEWWARCLDLDAAMEHLAGDDTLPTGADRARVDAWSVRTHLEHWSTV